MSEFDEKGYPYDLNEVTGIHTTAENLAHWIWDTLIAAGLWWTLFFSPNEERSTKLDFTRITQQRLEIGILRSLGATGWCVSIVFWIEGLALTLITWAISSVIGIPSGTGMVHVLDTFIQPFDVSVSPLLILITLLFAVVVSCAASFGPALSASRVRISETLRYE
jgi:FtsX-like permease family